MTHNPDSQYCANRYPQIAAHPADSAVLGICSCSTGSAARTATVRLLLGRETSDKPCGTAGAHFLQQHSCDRVRYVVSQRLQRVVVPAEVRRYSVCRAVELCAVPGGRIALVPLRDGERSGRGWCLDRNHCWRIGWYRR